MTEVAQVGHEAAREPGGARLLHGAPLAAALRDQVAEDTTAFERRYGYRPELAAVMVGRNGASFPGAALGVADLGLGSRGRRKLAGNDWRGRAPNRPAVFTS